MTFKDFAMGIFRLPATILNAFMALIFGGEQRAGLLDYAKFVLFNTLDFITFLGRSLSNLINNNKLAVASAFWASLIIAGATALTLFISPAALNFVANLKIAGYSIALLVGTDPTLQIITGAGISAGLTSVGVYFIASVINCFICLKNLCIAKALSKSETECEEVKETKQESLKTMSKLNSPNSSSKAQLEVVAEEPVHTPSVFKKPEDLIQDTSPSPSAKI